MKVGITATSKGATERQLLSLQRLLVDLAASELHHGDCVGGDAQGHSVARALGLWIVGHPPENSKARAFCSCDESRAPLPYLSRNRAIVRETELLIAMPLGFQEELRSGTWSTARFAEKSGRRFIVIQPDGVQRETIR